MTTVTIRTAEEGDIFGLDLNGKQIQVTATSDDEAAVAAALVTAVDNSTIADGGEPALAWHHQPL